jgi:site-specific recombinase XerD
MTPTDLPVVTDRPVLVAETTDVLARRSTNPALTDALQSASDYAAASKSEATRRAYRADWADFARWCDGVGLCPLPAAPTTLATYLAQLADAGKKVSTIRRRLAAVAYAHKLKGLVPPSDAETVRAVLSGIRRKIGVAVTRKAPATAQSLSRMLAPRRSRIPKSLISESSSADQPAPDLRALRDRALLLLGFAAALRRSELVALDVADLEFVERGVIVHVRVSKTDQEGAGAQIAIPNGKKLKPVAALKEWLEAAAIAEGPVFRSIDKGNRIGGRLTDRSVATIVKHYAAAAGFDDAIYSGHSMRAGFVTSALERGADFFSVMRVTRHRDVDTLRAYDRRAGLFKDHAGKDFL